MSSAKSSTATLGRPRLLIDFEAFEKLCEIQCTLAEIAGFFKVSEDTIERRCYEHYGTTFADAYKKHSAEGKTSLRRTQFRIAETNAAMAIWLGKQYLGQSDKQTHELSGKSDAELVALFTALTGGVGPPGPGPVPDGSDEPLDAGPGTADGGEGIAG